MNSINVEFVNNMTFNDFFAFEIINSNQLTVFNLDFSSVFFNPSGTKRVVAV